MQPAEKIPVAIFAAEPPFRAPTLGISPEEHGYGKNIDGKDTPRPNIKFDQAGRYEAWDDEMAGILRKHSGNTANGGDTFFEVPSEVLRHGRSLAGIVTASIPEDGLTEKDQDLVNSLVAITLKPLLNGAVEVMQTAVERFRVADFQVPAEGRQRPIIRGRLMELLEILEEQGIKPEQKEPEIKPE